MIGLVMRVCLYVSFQSTFKSNTQAFSEGYLEMSIQDLVFHSSVCNISHLLYD